jgi:hypothetical protein
MGYGIAIHFPFFLGDGISAISIAAASFRIASPIMINAWGALALGDLDSHVRVDDGVNLTIGHF